MAENISLPMTGPLFRFCDNWLPREAILRRILLAVLASIDDFRGKDIEVLVLCDAGVIVLG